MFSNPFSLDNKVILITGASSGIGRQCAISCSNMGAKVILIARNEERLKSVIVSLTGDSHLYYSLDVTNYHEIDAVINEVVNKLGKIDGFIHSAGSELTKPLKMMNNKDYEILFAVNVVSGFEFAKSITKKKYSKNGASFVFISSIMGIVGNSALVGYCASKGALISGVRALAIEYASRKMRFNCVSPGYIETEMMESVMGKLGENELNNIRNRYPLGLGCTQDVANSCIYLLSDASRWVTGTNLIVDGGYSAR
jgi:NAD(P)-dependent dehydrogenase (short-subunit alcohol dehydrogenase family)